MSRINPFWAMLALAAGLIALWFFTAHFIILLDSTAKAFK